MSNIYNIKQISKMTKTGYKQVDGFFRRNGWKPVATDASGKRYYPKPAVEEYVEFMAQRQHRRAKKQAPKKAPTAAAQAPRPRARERAFTLHYGPVGDGGEGVKFDVITGADVLDALRTVKARLAFLETSLGVVTTSGSNATTHTPGATAPAGE